MFTNLFKLKRKSISSNGSRKFNKFAHRLFFQNKFKKLSIKKKWNAGRGANGNIIIRTKSSLLVKQKTIKINYNLRYNKLGFIATFQLIPFKNKMVSLVYFSNGAVSYFLATRVQKCFFFWYLNIFKIVKRFYRKTIYSILAKIKKLTYISLIEITPGAGAQYCRSAGNIARLLNLNENNYTALISLPSGVKKLFSYYSFACIGRIKLKNHKKYKNTSAGYWRSFGCKSIVRGVAMNPVDHPHGGRTKAIKYPRTPWGKTTKFK